MVFLEPEGLVSLVAGVKREQGKRDHNVPGVGEAAVDGHRVFVVPFVGETRSSSQDAREGLVATRYPARHVNDAGLERVEMLLG